MAGPIGGASRVLVLGVEGMRGGRLGRPSGSPGADVALGEPEVRRQGAASRRDLLLQSRESRAPGLRFRRDPGPAGRAAGAGPGSTGTGDACRGPSGARLGPIPSGSGEARPAGHGRPARPGALADLAGMPSTAGPAAPTRAGGQGRPPAESSGRRHDTPYPLHFCMPLTPPRRGPGPPDCPPATGGMSDRGGRPVPPTPDRQAGPGRPRGRRGGVAQPPPSRRVPSGANS